ncbi:MAG: NAD(+) synthase [Myxococcota bacterium]
MKPQDVLEELLARADRTQAELRSVHGVEARWEHLPSRTTSEALDLMAEWIRLQVRRIGAKGCVVGASGGVDSSLVALLATRALPGECSALIMPCRSDPQDESDARQLLELLRIPYRVTSLEPAVDALVAAMGDTPTSVGRMVSGNLASRIRGALLYYEANRTSRLVLGTGNLDETYVGYSSKGTTADLFPITGLHKEEVRALLYLGLKELDEKLAARLSQRTATPGYWAGQEAEKELGLPYRRIGAALDVIIGQCAIENTGVIPRDDDEFIRALEGSGVPGQDILDVAALIMRNHHKGFGSPALWRPEPYLPDSDDTE